MSEDQRTCDYCGKDGARVRRLTRTYGEGSDLFLIENVPVVSCPHCGESYLEATTLREIERIRLNRKSLVQPRSVDVVYFQ